MSADPLELEKIHSMGTVPLWDLLRDDHAWNSDETDLPESYEMFHVFSGEAREDISVSTPELVIPVHVESSGGFSAAIASAFANEAGRRDEPGPALDPLSMIPEVPVSGGAIFPRNTQSEMIVSFPASEVRQNAFFFVVSRGGMITDQPGNKRLRRIINMYAQVYIHTRRVDRGALKRQVFDLCRCQFEFVIQKQAFMRSYDRHLLQKGGRHLSSKRIRSILEANGGVQYIVCCEDTDFIRVGDECALDVVGHLLRDAANDLRRLEKKK